MASSLFGLLPVVIRPEEKVTAINLSPHQRNLRGGCPRGVMVKAMACKRKRVRAITFTFGQIILGKV